jgi:hypothetical protein
MSSVESYEVRPAADLQHQQWENTRLRNRKLQLEIETLEKRSPWYRTLVPLFSTLIAVAGFMFGVVKYAQEQARNRETEERAFMKPWLDNQQATYSEALSAATTVANANDSTAKTAATEKFWELYQGPMILVETKSVSGAMIRFGNCLGTDQCDRNEMNGRVRALATAIAQSMAATAQMNYQQFALSQFKYKSD